MSSTTQKTKDCSICGGEGFQINFRGELRICDNRDDCPNGFVASVSIQTLRKFTKVDQTDHEAIFDLVKKFPVSMAKKEAKLMDIMFIMRNAAYYGLTDSFYKLFEEGKRVHCATSVEEFCVAAKNVAAIAAEMPR